MYNPDPKSSAQGHIVNRIGAAPNTLITLIVTTLLSIGGFPEAVAQSAPSQGIDMGDASVLSQQGQRLKVAVPYGSDVGEKFPLLRFEVRSVEAAAGQSAPVARDFTISKPESRNVIFLQSKEPITASNLKLVLAVAGSPGQLLAYDLAVPPASATTRIQEAPKPAVMKKGKRKGKISNKARRSSMKRR
jgi:hypothetical protein